MPFTKQGEFTKKPSDLPDVPSPSLTPTEIKSYFDNPPNELKTNVNKLMDDLAAQTAAGELGALDGTTPTNVQERLTKFKTDIASLGTNKTDKTGNHEGTWQGFTPSQVDETVGSRLDQHDAQLAEIAKTDIVFHGGKNDQSMDVSELLVDLISKGHKAFHFSAGKFLISNNVVLPENAQLTGEGMGVTFITSNITGNKELFTYGNGVNEYTDSLKVEGFTFTNENSTKEDGYAFKINGGLNAVFEKCFFVNLGGGAVSHTNTSNVTMDKCYAFGCGKNPFYQSPDYGAIHIDRSAGYANTFNISNVYISNCTAMSGINVSSHAIRLNNVTIESCHTLLKIGSSAYVSRNLTVIGLYLENPKTYGIDMINVLSGIFVNTYVNDASSTAEKSIKMAISERVKFINCSLGDKGFEADDNCADIKFDDCIGVFPSSGINGINVPQRIRDVDLFSGYFGLSHNYIDNSNDFTVWGGNVTKTPQNNFVDGSSSTLISKSSASDDLFKSIIRSYEVGDKIVGSIYINGNATIKLRGRRTSDNVYEDVKSIPIRNTGWKRVFISATLDKQYNLMTFRITPENYGVASGSCEVSRGQFEIGRLTPGVFILTEGFTRTNNVNGVVNGNQYVTGKTLAEDGFGVGNSLSATTLGTITKKMEVFDANGVSLGFVPIYDSIT